MDQMKKELYQTALNWGLQELKALQDALDKNNEDDAYDALSSLVGESGSWLNKIERSS